MQEDRCGNFPVITGICDATSLKYRTIKMKWFDKKASFRGLQKVSCEVVHEKLRYLLR